MEEKEKEFLREWFGLMGREVGCPNRFFINDQDEFLKFVEKCNNNKLPCYASVQPYIQNDTPVSIQKLFFEFDNLEKPYKAWHDAYLFSKILIHYYNVKPLIVFSGRKGYHVYVFFKKELHFKKENLEIAKKCYKEIQQKILKGLLLPTLDESNIGDIKRLSRVPFSFHEKTNNKCQPIDLKQNPIIPKLEEYKENGLEEKLFEMIIKELKEKEGKIEKMNIKKKNVKNIRPCILEALNKKLDNGNGHLMRLAIVREFLAANYKKEEIISLFKNQLDFNPEKTKYYIDHAIKKPAKPFKCSTIKELGFCLEECKWK